MTRTMDHDLEIYLREQARDENPDEKRGDSEVHAC
jgi:hypothetical protein